jgi:hypothetical protein
MSGPDYPRYAPGASPGGNAIGSFQIGLSPIGTIPSFDLWTTVISQYADSDRLIGIISSFNAAMDMTENLDNLYDFCWNVLTAVGYGLDCWGRIVGVGRALSFPGSVSYLGFEEAGSSWTGFGQGILFSDGGTTTNFQLSDADFRLLILAKAAANITDGSIASFNAILLALFPLRGRCYLADNQNMTATMTFQFPLNPIETAIVQQDNILPYPCGVVINIVQP